MPNRELDEIMKKSAVIYCKLLSNHSPPTSAEVKKMWIYTSTTPYAFMA
jgi:hypothetical protein